MKCGLRIVGLISMAREALLVNVARGNRLASAYLRPRTMYAVNHDAFHKLSSRARTRLHALCIAIAGA